MNCLKCGGPLNGAAFCAACGTPADAIVAITPMPKIQPKATEFQAPQPPFSPAPPTNGLAIAGFVTSILCLSPVGLVLSIVALNQIKKSPLPQGGSGMAIAGLVLGGIPTLLFVFIWLSSTLYFL